ncbi:tryptophan synthase subunit alpha [Catellatospora sp. KI3]|uniref:tryptophan synthase subunit alpha n=1 Tax=Catellatospora sp. KI3 TaxID=3041620 RepID=UPI00248223D5|nr:tryptophan synthase subunit alpha [Catellatospora sp. KI3]MDI1466049.1 tryptophan synthase subunit alpha [Catellatospora sp. KI3]
MTATISGTALGPHLRRRRDAGRKLLAPYLTGGVRADWTDYLLAYAEAGADTIEVGLPFSEPVVDGPTVQEASHLALRRGANVRDILADLRRVRVGIPLTVMTYYHLVQREGAEVFCANLAGAGVRGLIVPDLPVDELGTLERAATAAGVDLVLVAAPSSTPARLREIGTRSRGFVYAVSVMAPTGVRDELADTAGVLAGQLKQATDLPVLLGFGIATPAHAVAGAHVADGVAVGSALMRAVLDGESPAQVGARVAAMRDALDRAYP